MQSVVDRFIPERSATEHEELASVVAEWELLSREEPWHIAPQRYGIDSLHETIAAILDVRAWGSSGAFAAERLVRSAAAHGEQRRAQGVPDDALFREYHALRAAIWRHLQRHQHREPTVIAEFLRVDVAIGVATTIALRGYHRSELPAGESWESDILRQVGAVSRHLGDLLSGGART
jgi:hypothetical protein